MDRTSRMWRQIGELLDLHAPQQAAESAEAAQHAIERASNWNRDRARYERYRQEYSDGRDVS